MYLYYSSKCCVTVDSNSCISVTIQNHTRVNTNSIVDSNSSLSETIQSHTRVNTNSIVDSNSSLSVTIQSHTRVITNFPHSGRYSHLLLIHPV